MSLAMGLLLPEQSWYNYSLSPSHSFLMMTMANWDRVVSCF
jgi:hypothetical protein